LKLRDEPFEFSLEPLERCWLILGNERGTILGGDELDTELYFLVKLNECFKLREEQ
jgi:hypothetical protein